MKTFAENAKIGAAAVSLREAMLNLSNMGLLVKSFRGNPDLASIEIDRPLDGAEPEFIKHDKKTYASVAGWGCRIYWAVIE